MTRTPHIAHIFSTFKIGGPQVRFAGLAEHLKGRFTHSVIALDGDMSCAALLPSYLDVRFPAAPSKTGPLLPRLRRYRAFLKDMEPDLLVTYNWGAIEWALANRGGALPHIHIEDGFGPEEASTQLTRRVWMRRIALARTPAIVVPSLTLKKLAIQEWRLQRERVRYIPNGIRPRDAVQTRLADIVPSLPPRALRIVWAGAMRAEKNLGRLVRAFAKSGVDGVLILAGDGPERQTVQREAAAAGVTDRIVLLGQRGDVRDIVMQCDVMALSSDTEQMPLAILEAMDAGIPVASVDTGDVRAMLARENVPCVTAKSDEALAASLAALAADELLRRRIGAANRARARTAFRWSDMADAYEKLFGSVTGTARAGGARLVRGA